MAAPSASSLHRQAAGLAKAFLRMAEALDRQEMESRARARLASSVELAPYAELLLDWPADAERWEWLATEPEAALCAWAEWRKTWQLEDVERYPDAG